MSAIEGIFRTYFSCWRFKTIIWYTSNCRFIPHHVMDDQHLLDINSSVTHQFFYPVRIYDLLLNIQFIVQ